MFYILCTLLLSSFASVSNDERLIEYANPLIGTGGRLWASSMLSPAASTPFGMVKLGPDTRFFWWVPEGIHKMALGTSGYYAPHSRLRGFSHSRLQGTGARVGGAFRFLPFSRVGKRKRLRTGVTYRHSDEVASPGYYRVFLPQEKITAEMTASPRCGFHRYTFHKKNRAKFLMLDLTSSLLVGSPAKDAHFEMLNDKAFSAHSRQHGSFAGRYGGLTSYAYAEFLHAPKRTDWLAKDKLLFEFQQNEIQLKLCLSYVSINNAKLNFESEIKNKSFNDIHGDAEVLWENRFSPVRIRADKRIMHQFYTALYHTMLMPTIMTDVNQEYLGFKNNTGRADDFTYVSDLSLWDTFRTTHPLYTLFAQDMQINSVKSLIAMADILGELPRWPQGAGDSRSMFGNPANFLMSETYLKKIGDFDARKALNYMVDSVLNPKQKPLRDPVCFEHAYCPAERVEESVSKTLEYAWSDYATATLALALGETKIAEDFFKLSQNFINVWDPETRYFRGKNTDGTWTKLNPSLLTYVDFRHKTSRPYVEGSPRHWRFSVPHNGKKLAELFGGRENFISELDYFASRSSQRRAALNPTSYYWHGNQHDIHSLYLFNEVEASEYTQYWVRWALSTRYGLSRDGYDGNDDGGTLSGWYVLSSLGLYPQAGTDKYWIGSPNIKQGLLKIGKNELQIIAKNQSEENVYIQSVYLNEKRVCRPELYHQELKGKLIFYMQSQPVIGGSFRCER